MAGLCVRVCSLTRSPLLSVQLLETRWTHRKKKKPTVIRFQTSEFVCSTKLEIYLSPREVIFLFPSLTNRRDLKKTKNREVPRDLRRLSSPFIDVSLFVLFFFWRFCNFKTMTSNSCLRCDLKESWLWGRNGPSCGFISNSFFKCLLLDLSVCSPNFVGSSVASGLSSLQFSSFLGLSVTWLLLCLHFGYQLIIEAPFLLFNLFASVTAHQKKREISRNSTRGPRRAITSVKYKFQVRRETAATRWDTSDRNVGLNSTNSIYLTLDTQEPLLDNGAVNQ